MKNYFRCTTNINLNGFLVHVISTYKTFTIIDTQRHGQVGHFLGNDIYEPQTPTN